MLREIRRSANCSLIILVVTMLALVLATRTQSGERTNDYIEYENLVLSSLYGPEDVDPPNYREIYLRRMAQYEAFLKKYPNSRLVLDAKLQIASFSYDVDRPEVYPIYLEERRCRASARSYGERRRCIEKREQDLAALGSTRDPYYKNKSALLRQELLQITPGQRKHYVMLKRDTGRVQEINEDIGAYILYNEALDKGVCKKKEIYLRILDRYIISEQYKKEILNFFEDHPDLSKRC